jgi:hypothetical protein
MTAVKNGHLASEGAVKIETIRSHERLNPLSSTSQLRAGCQSDDSNVAQLQGCIESAAARGFTRSDIAQLLNLLVTSTPVAARSTGRGQPPSNEVLRSGLAPAPCRIYR